MTEFLAGQVDIAVIGAGHAGIEAALAAAKAEYRRLAALGSLIDTLGDVTPEIKAQYLAKKAKNTTLLRIQPLQITGKASRSYVPVTQRMAGPGRQA